jgi:PAS domain S-box-containing protein
MLGEITRPWRAERPVTLLGLLCVLALGFAAGLLALPFLHWQSGKTALELGALLLATLVIHSVVRNAAKVQALTQSLRDENSYRSFVMSAIEGVFRTTHDGQYLFANPALARIYGHSTPEHLMRELTNIADQLYVNPGRRKEFQRELHENGYVADFKSQIRRRDGTLIWIAENSRPVFDKDGEFLFYEGTVEDITARREAEEAIRQAMVETREAVRSKNAFLAAVSHELKTPLNAVIGFSELILSEVCGPLRPEKYREYISDIHCSGTKLLEMITDILDFTRIEGKLIDLDERLLVIRDLVNESTNIVRPERAGVRIATAIAADLPLLRGDHRCIRQALVHLLRNAVEFAPPGTAIRLDAALDAKGGIAISVADSVAGMKRDGVCGLARRLEDKALSLVNAFVKLHDGEIAVETLPEIGTKIGIVFPPQRTVFQQAAA